MNSEKLETNIKGEHTERVLTHKPQPFPFHVSHGLIKKDRMKMHLHFQKRKKMESKHSTSLPNHPNYDDDKSKNGRESAELKDEDKYSEHYSEAKISNSEIIRRVSSFYFDDSSFERELEAWATERAHLFSPLDTGLIISLRSST